jgi:predicted O-methyltransferase YrrM
MKFDEIASIVDGIPYTSRNKGKIFYDFVIENRPVNCLELGFAHGVSSCYIAAALHELGRGHLTSVDLEKSKEHRPNIEELLKRTNLEDWVKIVREKNTYNWFLRNQIEKQSGSNYNCDPIYDFCFIDGPKNWTIDGLAFFLVDKLLKNNGWLIFDDYEWSFLENKSIDMKVPGLSVDVMNDSELVNPHIKEVFHKLVMQHDSYSNFRVEDNILAYAQKVKSPKVKISFESKASFKHKFISLLKSGLGRRY